VSWFPPPKPGPVLAPTSPRCGFDDVIERATLVRRRAFHGLDQVRDQVVALLELDVDIGQGLVDALVERNQPDYARRGRTARE
jgi:hypothetical protein